MNCSAVCLSGNIRFGMPRTLVDADIVGKIDSDLNPSGGIIQADSIEELTIEKDKVNPDKTKIICRAEESQSPCVCA